MNINRLLLLALALPVMMLCSCVHEWPEEPAPEAPKSDCTLVLDFDRADFDHLTTVEVGADGRVVTRAADNVHSLHHIVRITTVEGSKSRSATRATFDYYEAESGWSDDFNRLSIPLNLPQGEYEIMAWTDFRPQGADPYYDTADFTEIALHGSASQSYVHSANNSWRMAWRGYVRIKVDADCNVTVTSTDGTDEPSRADDQVIVPMTRPFARYHFITTDLKEFFTRTRAESQADETKAGQNVPVHPNTADYVVRVRYTGYMPVAYNLRTDKPVDSRTGVSYQGSMRIIDENTAELAFDHIFVNHSSTSTQVALDLYRRSDGKLLSSTPIISVPLQRGRYTVVRGPLLTTTAGAGMGVNPGFYDDFNISIY